MLWSDSLIVKYYYYRILPNCAIIYFFYFDYNLLLVNCHLSCNNYLRVITPKSVIYTEFDFICSTNCSYLCIFERNKKHGYCMYSSIGQHLGSTVVKL